MTKKRAAIIGIFLCIITAVLVQPPNVRAFVHPGGLSVQADFNRMATNVAAGNHPWIDSYNKLATYSQAQTNWNWAPVPVIYRCGSGCVNNFSRSQQDALAIYYNALRYRITGDANYANHAIQGMDAWSGTCTNVSGDSNWALAAGLCGYEFACAGEELRGYTGWSAASQNNYSNFLETVFYAGNHTFLTSHNGTCDTHYRCNWDCCNMASMIAVAVFCDDTNAFNEAIAYYTNGLGNGNIERAVLFVHPDGLGQCEESGRDQAHCMDGFNSLSTFCQVAWNQGVDMYGYDNNRYLRGLEYIAKYNLNPNNNTNWVPYVHHRNCLLTYDEASVWGSPLGVGQFFWETPFAHYAGMKGIAAPYTGLMAALSRPDGGISNWNSPDWFGFTSLTAYLGSTANNAPAPSGLAAVISGRQITLNWWGTALATNYNVKRATTSGGPYTTIAVTGPNDPSYVDAGLTAGRTYYYVVSANQPAGETGPSPELAASPNDVATGNVIGSPGSYNNTAATIVNAFDNSFENFYDATNATGDWTGIDLGPGVSNVVTGIDFAPRSGFASRMVGGVFQGALGGDPGFANPVTLYTIPTQPTDAFFTAQNAVLTSVAVNNPTAFRYLRYDGPANASCNVSQVIFHGQISGLTAPAAPAGATAATPSYKQVNLSWNASAGATSYTIKRSTASGGPFIVLDNLGSSDLTALNSNTNYTDYSAVAGATYYYVIAALNGAGETDAAQIIVTTPNMPTPTGLAVVAGDTQVSLNWASTGAPTYNVKRSTVSGGPYTTIANVSVNGFADTNVVNGTSYYYVVSGVDGVSESPNSSEANAIPAVQTAISINFVGGSSNNGTPSPMGTGEKAGVMASAHWNNASGAAGTASSLAQDDGTSTGASASWSANNTWSTPIPESPGNYRLMKGYIDTSATSTTTVTVSNLPAAYTANGYSVYVYCDGDNGSSTKTGVYAIGTTTINATDNAGANFSGTYLQANNSAGNYVMFTNQTGASFTLSAAGLSTDSGPRGPINGIQIVANQASAIPAAPTALRATGGNLIVNLGWTQSTSPGITGNNVYRSTSGSGGPYSLLANLAATTAYSDTAVSAGSTYFYSVTAVNGSGESAMSAYSGATTVPPSPTGLVATAGNNQVALSWNAASGATSYNVKRATVSGGPYTTIASPTTASYTDTTAVNGTTYYYVVSAVNSSGESANSAQVSATPAAPVTPTAPTNLTASAGRKKVTLTWTQSASPNISSNKVYRATANGGPYTLVVSIAATTTYTDTGLTTGTTYYYVVTAVNSSGLESPFSNQASATSK